MNKNNKKLRIGLIMQGGKDWIGGTQYIKNIIYALASLPQEVRATFEICLICSKSFDAEEYNQIRKYLDDVYYLESELAEFTLLNRIRWKLIRTFNQQENPRFDEFIESKKIDFLYPYFANNKKPTSYRSAAWIPDFQHKYLTSFFSDEDLRQRDYLFTSIAEQSSMVILSSKTVEEDFYRFFSSYKSKSKVLAFKTSIDSSYYDLNPLEVSKKYNLPEKFFIVCNQFWQHKNHILIFQALRLLQKKLIYPHVVCTGRLYDGRHPDYMNTLLRSIHELGIFKQVYILGLIARDEQVQLMRSSISVIQPSLFEGWSTVVEDSRCLGKSTILSDIPVHLEQAPINSHYFKRDSVEDLASLMEKLWLQQSSGLDVEKEMISREANAKEVKNFGFNFLEIAQDINRV